MERQLEVDFAKFGLMVCQHSKTRLEDKTAFMFYAEVELILEQKTPKNG